MPDKTMQKWPVNLEASFDRITPYPCQCCHKLFTSCKGLREHKCRTAKPRKAKA